MFTAAATFWFHDFWTMTGGDRMNNMAHALKNLSLIGALLVFFVIGPWRPDVLRAGGAASLDRAIVRKMKRGGLAATPKFDTPRGRNR